MKAGWHVLALDRFGHCCGLNRAPSEPAVAIPNSKWYKTPLFSQKSSYIQIHQPVT